MASQDCAATTRRKRARRTSPVFDIDYCQYYLLCYVPNKDLEAVFAAGSAESVKMSGYETPVDIPIDFRKLRNQLWGCITALESLTSELRELLATDPVPLSTLVATGAKFGKIASQVVSHGSDATLREQSRALHQEGMLSGAPMD